MFDPGKIKGIINKAVHDPRQPHAQFVNRLETLDFLQIFVVKSKNLLNVRPGVDAGAGNQNQQFQNPGFDFLQIKIAEKENLAQQLV